MNKYQFESKTQLGIAYYYCYGDDRFENWLRIKNIKFKKLTERMTSGKNLFNEKDKEIERLNKELKLKTDFIEELLTLISVARDYELHDKCYTRSRIYQDKLKELKEGK